MAFMIGHVYPGYKHDCNEDHRRGRSQEKWSNRTDQQCSRCTRLEKKLRESEDIVKDMAEANDGHNYRIKVLGSDKDDLLRLNEKISNSSNQLTKHMADALELNGDLEDTGDDFSSMKLSKRFDAILDDKWVPLLEYFVVDEGKDELTVINHMSKLLQECYALCVQQADNQIRGFLLLGEDDVIPDNDAVSVTYKWRRINGQTKEQRSKITQIVMEKMRESKSKDLDEEPKQELQTKLDEFFEDYIDCCWLMTISKPRLILQFNVINKVHAGQLLKSFKKYATEEAVKDAKYCKGTILHVVWPTVSQHNAETVFYTKGEVITVDECKVSDEANDS